MYCSRIGGSLSSSRTGMALEDAGEVRLVELEPRELSAALDLRERGGDELDAAALLANLDLVARP